MSEQKITRTKAQEMAMTAIYDALNYVYMGEEVPIKEIISGLSGVSYEESDLYVKKVLIASLSHLNEIIALYQENMPRWKFSRLDRIEQAILLLAYAHLAYVEIDVPRPVVINNAIELAKRFLEPSDYKFVNAILDKTLPIHNKDSSHA